MELPLGIRFSFVGRVGWARVRAPVAGRALCGRIRALKPARASLSRGTESMRAVALASRELARPASQFGIDSRCSNLCLGPRLPADFAHGARGLLNCVHVPMIIPSDTDVNAFVRNQ